MLKKRSRKESSSSKNIEDVIVEEKVNTKKQKINNSVEEDDFQTLGISPFIKEKLAEKKILTLFEVQKKVYQPVYDGKNVIVAALTGSGKTLAFALPTVQRNMDKGRLGKQPEPLCLVIAPTRELSIQVGREFSDLSCKGLPFKTALIYGGVSIDDQIWKLRAGVDIIIGTPGRIMDMIERGELRLNNIRSVILDEADKMLSMGFQEAIEDIFKKIYENRKKVQVLLFSATIESWVKQVANNITKGEKMEFIDLVKDLGGRTPKTVQHLAVNTVKYEKVTTIADLILCYGGKNKATIVFVNTKRECNELMISDKIKQDVQIIHGDINQKQREATIEGFKSGKFKCLVATDVASRGLDIPMVDLVIQSEPPKEVDSYIHRAGRTARAGRSGICITLYSKFTEGLLTRIEQKAKFQFKKIGAPQTRDIIDSTIRDITVSMNKVDDSMVDFFNVSAKKVIEEYGAEKAVARLFAHISGHTDKIKSRSLLCGAEGFITYQIKFNSKFNHGGYIWGFFKRILPEEVKARIRGMRIFKTMDGTVFDYPEETHKVFEEIIFNDKMYGANYELVKINDLPDLLDNETPGFGSANNSFGGNNNNFGNNRGNNNNNFNKSNSSNSNNRFGNNNSGTNTRSASTSASQPGRIDFFVGNLPYKIDDATFKTWIKNNGVDPSDLEVRLAVDKETQQLRGFGFISAFDPSRIPAVLSLDGKDFNNRALKISQAQGK